MSQNISDAAVSKATGRGWGEWFELLEKAGAAEMSHKEIARWLIDAGHIASENEWWAQAVTVGYEYDRGRRVKGETKDAGFQVGVQRTLELPASDAWTLITGSEAREIWLGGSVPDLEFEPGARAETSDGHEIEIRSVKKPERIRLRWRPPRRPTATTLQLYLLGKGDRTALRFHQEHLANPDERERMKRHWTDVLGRLRSLARDA